MTMELIPRTGKKSVRGCQVEPPSSLRQTPPSGVPMNSRKGCPAEAVTQLTRPMLVSYPGMLTGPRGCQFDE